MKNIIVISDTHNRLPSSERFWETLDIADYIFHLGDGLRDIEKLKEAFPDKLVYVYGNNDFKTSELEKTVEIEGVKFFSYARTQLQSEVVDRRSSPSRFGSRRGLLSLRSSAPPRL